MDEKTADLDRGGVRKEGIWVFQAKIGRYDFKNNKKNEGNGTGWADAKFNEGGVEGWYDPEKKNKSPGQLVLFFQSGISGDKETRGVYGIGEIADTNFVGPGGKGVNVKTLKRFDPYISIKNLRSEILNKKIDSESLLYKFIVRRLNEGKTGYQHTDYFFGGKDYEDIMAVLPVVKTFIDARHSPPVPGKAECEAKEMDIEEELEERKIENDPSLTKTEKEQLVKARIGQGEFREHLFDISKSCFLCGVDVPTLLKASHIKRWAKSSNEERLDRYNGLLLCPNHDSLFDKGYITFDDAGEIEISVSLDSNCRKLMTVDVHMRLNIAVRDEHKKYLDYHRKNIFKAKAR